MGGYAAYVWTSYGLAFVVLLVQYCWAAVQRRRLLPRDSQRGQRVEEPAMTPATQETPVLIGSWSLGIGTAAHWRCTPSTRT